MQVLTTRNLVDLVLNEIVDQRNQCSKEQASHNFTVLDGTAVVRAERKATQGPRQSRHQVRDHEDVMPVVIIGRCDIGPTTACQCPEDAHAGNQLG